MTYISEGGKKKKGVKVTVSNSDNNRNQLIEHLYAVLNTEMEKPYEEIDADFIEVCVELILELQGKNFTLSNEEIEELVRKIPFVEVADFEAIQQSKKKKLKKRKILLIAAIIAILCTLLAVISSGRFVDYWHSVMNEKFGSVFNVPVGETYTEDNEEFFYAGNSVKYTSVQNFFEKEDYDVLLPNKLPADIELIDINILNYDNSIIVHFNSVITAYDIHLDVQLPQKIIDIANETVTINGLICYIYQSDSLNTVQIYFEHNGNYYLIGGTNRQILLDIIENLEELK